MAPSQEQVTEEHGSPISDATVYAMKIGLGVKATAIPQMEANAEGASVWRLSPYASQPNFRDVARQTTRQSRIGLHLSQRTLLTDWRRSSWQPDHSMLGG